MDLNNATVICYQHRRVMRAPGVDKVLKTPRFSILFSSCLVSIKDVQQHQMIPEWTHKLTATRLETFLCIPDNAYLNSSQWHTLRRDTLAHKRYWSLKSLKRSTACHSHSLTTIQSQKHHVHCQPVSSAAISIRESVGSKGKRLIRLPMCCVTWP